MSYSPVAFTRRYDRRDYVRFFPGHDVRFSRSYRKPIALNGFEQTLSVTGNDGYEQVGTTNWESNPTSPVSGFNTVGLISGALYHYGVRFTDITVPAQTEIQSAKIYLYQRRTLGAPTADWYCYDVDNAPIFDAVTHYPTNIITGLAAGTSATSSYTDYNSSTLAYIEHDVTAPAQEVINRAGFAGTLAFIAFSDTGSTAFDNIEDLSFTGGDNPPILQITWL